MYHPTPPLPVYITSDMTGRVKPTPVFAVNADSEWVTPAQFYAYTGGSALEPPASAPTTYATIDSVDFALNAKADKTYVDTQDAQFIKRNDSTKANSVYLEADVGTSILFSIDSSTASTLKIGGSSTGTKLQLGKLTQQGGAFNGEIYFGDNTRITTQPNTIMRKWTLPGTTEDVHFLHTGTTSQRKEGMLEVINEIRTRSTVDTAPLILRGPASPTGILTLRTLNQSANNTLDIPDMNNTNAEMIISRPKYAQRIYSSLDVGPGLNIYGTNTGKLSIYGPNTTFDTIILSEANTGTKVWTLPAITESSARFLYGGTNTLTTDPVFTKASTNMEFYIRSGSGNYSRLYVGDTSIGSYLFLGRQDLTGGVANGEIRFGANTAITTEPNIGLREWTLPTTSGDVDFLHTGNNPQTKTGTLTMYNFKMNATTPTISSIETAMPATPDDTQLLTAKAVKDAIGGGGGSYLPLAGGTMNTGSTITFNSSGTNCLYFDGIGIKRSLVMVDGVYKHGLFMTNNTANYKFSTLPLYVGGFSESSIQIDPNYDTTYEPTITMKNPANKKRFQAYTSNTQGSLELYKDNDGVGVRLEATTQGKVIADRAELSTAIKIGNTTIQTYNPDNVTWFIPSTLPGEYIFAYQAQLPIKKQYRTAYLYGGNTVINNHTINEPILDQRNRTVTFTGLKYAMFTPSTTSVFLYFGIDNYIINEASVLMGHIRASNLFQEAIYIIGEGTDKMGVYKCYDGTRVVISPVWGEFELVIGGGVLNCSNAT